MVKKFAFSSVVLVICLVAGNALGFRVIHPESGLKNSLGSAKSGIALYRQTENFNKGDLVIVNTGIKEQDPALALVSNISEDGIDVQSGPQIQRVPREKILGRLLLVFPFIGTLISFVGL